jgi:hypothetical protein
MVLIGPCQPTARGTFDASVRHQTGPTPPMHRRGRAFRCCGVGGRPPHRGRHRTPSRRGSRHAHRGPVGRPGPRGGGRSAGLARGRTATAGHAPSLRRAPAGPPAAVGHRQAPDAAYRGCAQPPEHRAVRGPDPRRRGRRPRTFAVLTRRPGAGRADGRPRRGGGDSALPELAGGARLPARPRGRGVARGERPRAAPFTRFPRPFRGNLQA